MTNTAAEEFVRRWAVADLREQQAAQSHFNELCHLLGVQTPTEADPKGEFFTFEQHVTRDGGKAGRADVWYKKRFAWEYKGKRKNLDAAYSQLQSYSSSLNFPPLLVVCDLLEYRIYPQWPNIDHRPWIVLNEGLKTEYGRDLLRRVLTDPDSFYRERQGEIDRRERITADLARQFSRLAQILQDERYGGAVRYDPMQIARFLTKLLFAMFAEDIDLLPVFNGQKVLEFIFEHSRKDPEVFASAIKELFGAMAGKQPRIYLQRVPYFNGGLFDDKADDLVLDLSTNEDARNVLFEVNLRDWKEVEPSIFGTLFERALDPTKRAQLGAHYTSENDIRLVIEPVLMSPLRRRWLEVLTQAAPLWVDFNSDAPRTQSAAKAKLKALYDQMLEEVAAVTVLDPACGSGNFLYVSLLALKDFEEEIHSHFKPLGLPVERRVSPRQLMGIELNGFAAELAHVVVWIGDLQWQHRKEGYSLRTRFLSDTSTPVIDERLEEGQPPRILNADAILRYDSHGVAYEPEWPSASVIIGNPPFLGGNKIRSELGKYVDDLFKLYEGRVPAFADLVTYWHEKARAHIEAGKAKRAGLISTNSIRGGANRTVLERIKQTGNIFMAWSDNPWILEGAAVRISLVGFDDGTQTERLLDGNPVTVINADLTSTVDITQAKPLKENREISFMGPSPKAPFDISSEIAKEMLAAKNSSGKSNSYVVRPVVSAVDIAQRSREEWTIYFPPDTTEQEAMEYEAPYQYAMKVVKPIKEMSKQTSSEKSRWWLYSRPRPEMLAKINHLYRVIVTPAVSKHRLFIWMPVGIVSNQGTLVFARDDDYFFGVLHSYIHEIWSLRLGTSLEDRPRYTPTTTFETFPFPPNQAVGRDSIHAVRPDLPDSVIVSALDSTDRMDPVPTTDDGDSGDTAGIKPDSSLAFAVPPSPLVGEGSGVRGIALAAAALHAERHAWLNPVGIMSSDPLLKKLTLTNLYNALTDHRAGKTISREAFPFEGAKFIPRLAQLHTALDSAVLHAYGWDDLIGSVRTPAGDEEVLRRLLAENLRRAGS